MHEADEWRLGVESGGAGVPGTTPIALPQPHLAGERLDRPLFVITAELLGWFGIALFALASRLWMLGARPLDPREALAALSELGAWSHPIMLLRGSPDSAALPIRLFESIMFAAFGSDDSTARLAFAGFGLLLIASAFGFRRHVGRAGALGIAAMLALSPSVAYFSRSASTVLPAVALELAAILLFLELTRAPSAARAAIAGAISGLALALDPTALATAIILAATLAITGIVLAFATAHPMLGVRVWWERRRTLLLIFGVAMIGVWLMSAPEFISRNSFAPVVDAFRSNLSGSATRGFKAGLGFYLPMIALYEFLIAGAAIVGAIAVLTFRVRSMVAFAALVWTALAVAFWAWTPARSPATSLQMLAPMALLGGFAIDFLYRLRAWKVIRYVVFALAIATIFVQTRNDFVFYTPDSSEAPWARHMLLFWESPATTLVTPLDAGRIVEAASGGDGTVFFAEDSSVMRWFLRGLRSVSKIDEAAVIVGTVKPGSFSGQNDASSMKFEVSQAWHPRWNQVSWRVGLKYILNGRAWGDVETTDVDVLTRPLSSTVSTLIVAPAPVASPGDLLPSPPAGVP